MPITKINNLCCHIFIVDLTRNENKLNSNEKITLKPK